MAASTLEPVLCITIENHQKKEVMETVQVRVVICQNLAVTRYTRTCAAQIFCRFGWHSTVIQSTSSKLLAAIVLTLDSLLVERYCSYMFHLSM